MSTLMSRDLNVERSSTRLHAPPGGKTSICFGDDTAKPVARSSRGPPPTSSISFGADNVPPVSRSGAQPIGSYMKQQQQPVAQAPAPVQQSYAPTGNGYRVRQAPGGTSTFTLG